MNENINNNYYVAKYLVGNKSDLERKIDENEIKEFAGKNNIDYILTSAKENINIDKMFEKMTENLNKNVKESAQNNVYLDKYMKKKRNKCCMQ